MGDSGTHNISPAAPGPGAFGRPVGLDEGSYEFSFTAKYTTHDLACTLCNLIETAKTIAETDAKIREVADKLVGEAAKQGKDQVEKKPKKPVDEPAYLRKPLQVDQLLRAVGDLHGYCLLIARAEN